MADVNALPSLDLANDIEQKWARYIQLNVEMLQI